MSYGENTVHITNKLQSGMSHSTVGHEFNVNEAAAYEKGVSKQTHIRHVLMNYENFVTTGS